MTEEGTGTLQKVVTLKDCSDYSLTNIIVCAEAKSTNGVSGTNHLPTLQYKNGIQKGSIVAINIQHVHVSNDTMPLLFIYVYAENMLNSQMLPK